MASKILSHIELEIEIEIRDYSQFSFFTKSSVWSDSWLEGDPLNSWFRRLLDLAGNQMIFVVEMCSLGWGVGEEARK